MGIGIDNKVESKIILLQCRLIDNILKAVGVEDFNRKKYLSQAMPLVNDTTGGVV